MHVQTTNAAMRRRQAYHRDRLRTRCRHRRCRSRRRRRSRHSCGCCCLLSQQKRGRGKAGGGGGEERGAGGGGAGGTLMSLTQTRPKGSLPDGCHHRRRSRHGARTNTEEAYRKVRVVSIVCLRVSRGRRRGKRTVGAADLVVGANHERVCFFLNPPSRLSLLAECTFQAEFLGGRKKCFFPPAVPPVQVGVSQTLYVFLLPTESIRAHTEDGRLRVRRKRTLWSHACASRRRRRCVSMGENELFDLWRLGIWVDSEKVQFPASHSTWHFPSFHSISTVCLPLVL